MTDWTAGGTASGSSTIPPVQAGLGQLASGSVVGVGVLSIPVLVGTGTSAGSSTVTGDALLTIGVGGSTHGIGTLFGHFPDPVVGTSSMVAHLVSEQEPLPILASVSGIKALRWGSFLERGELVLYLRSPSGPVMPASVSYTLFELRNGYPFQVGQANRTPVPGSLGEFYATGRVGEGGQPGDWVIRWNYQRFFSTPISHIEHRFTVQDAVAAKDPRDTTQRVEKYGWAP